MKYRLYQLFGFLIALEGLIVGADIYRNITLSGGHWISKENILDVVLLSGVVLLVLIGSSICFVKDLRSNFIDLVDPITQSDKWLAIVLIGSLLLIYEVFQDILFLQAGIEDIHYQGYRMIIVKYFSLMGMILLIGLKNIFLISILYWEKIRSWLKTIITQKWFLIFIVFAILVILLDQSQYGTLYGLDKYAIFQLMNAPLLGIQVILVSIGLAMLFWILSKMREKWPWVNYLQNDIVVMAGIFLLTFFLWMQVSPGPNYFNDIPRPPNFEVYPTSDSLNYEISAQQIIVGNGYGWSNHPGYRFYLSVLHLIAGDGILDIRPIYIAVLSLMPVVLFKLAATLHTKFSGLVVALLYMIREQNSLFLGEHITVSNANILMSEPLVALGVMITALYLIVWMKSIKTQPLYPLIVGGLLGGLILIRIETLAMVPAVGLGLLFHFWSRLKTWFSSMVFIIVGLVLVLSPWVIFSYKYENSYDLFLGKGHILTRSISQYAPENQSSESPNKVDKSDLFPHHMANNIKQELFYLPSNHQPLLTFMNLPGLVLNLEDQSDMEGDTVGEKYLERYVRGLPYWWFDWDGQLAPRSYLPVFGTLALISVGIAQFKKREIWLSAILLLLLMAQNTIYSFVGQSGNRFILNVDWIPLVFYGIGLSVVLRLFLIRRGISIGNEYKTSSRLIANKAEKSTFLDQPQHLLLFTVLILFGLAVPLVPNLVPSRYSEEAGVEILDEVVNEYPDQLGFDTNLLSENSRLSVIYGKALYPRYFQAGNKMDDDRGGTIPDYSYSRVEFYMVGSVNTWVTLPINKTLEYFPHGSEVLVIGYPQNEVIDENGRLISGRYIKTQYLILLPTDDEMEPVVINSD